MAVIGVSIASLFDRFKGIERAFVDLKGNNNNHFRKLFLPKPCPCCEKWCISEAPAGVSVFASHFSPHLLLCFPQKSWSIWIPVIRDATLLRQAARPAKSKCFLKKSFKILQEKCRRSVLDIHLCDSTRPFNQTPLAWQAATAAFPA